MSDRIIAIVRLACTLAASVASLASVQLDADALTTGVLIAVAFACYVWTWWKNNNITQAAQQAQNYLDAIRENEEE